MEYEENKGLAKSLKNNIENLEGWTCIYREKTIFIFYKRNKIIGRQRFTISHEFGHISLLHLTKLNNDEYEKEANMFASRILMPLCVLKEIGARTPEEISKLCEVSLQSARYRAERLKMILQRKKFYTSKLEIKVIRNFRKYIRNKKR